MSNKTEDQDQARLKESAKLRQRAEEFLGGHAVDTATSSRQVLTDLAAGDTRRLIHELHIHQIELEMQNEELRRTYQQLETSRDKYSDLYNLAPLGYFSLDKDGVILEANLTGVDQLGPVRKTIIKKPFSHFVSKDSQDQFYLHRRQVFQTQTLQTCELKLVKTDGTEFYACLESVAVGDSGPIQDIEGNSSQFRMALIDITERVWAEEALRQRDCKVAVEQERHRLARELHDTVTQSLFSIALAAETSLKYLIQFGTPDKLREPVEFILTLAKNSFAEMKTQIYHLSPPILAEKGLSEALAQHSSLLSRHYGLAIEFIAKPELSLSIDQPIRSPKNS